MAFLSDILLASAAMVAALYCLILSRRLRKFTDLENGVGNAVALLAVKADDLDKSLRTAQATANQSVSKLEDVSTRAETAARHLELLVASLHSLPEHKKQPSDMNPFKARRTAPTSERA